MNRPLSVVVDVETTGVDPMRDRVIEVALVVTDWEEVYVAVDALTRPPGDAWAVPERHTDVTMEMLRDAGSFADVAPAVAALLAWGDEIVGYGVGFDLRMIASELARVGIAMPQRRVVNVMSVYPKCSLQVACARATLGFPKDWPWHRAMGDAIATLRLWGKVRTERGEWLVNTGEAESFGVGVRGG